MNKLWKMSHWLSDRPRPHCRSWTTHMSTFHFPFRYVLLNIQATYCKNLFASTCYEDASTCLQPEMDKSPRQPFITQSVHFRAWRWKCLSRRAHMAYSEVTLDSGTLFSNLVLSVWGNYTNVCANDMWWWCAIFREAHWSSLYFICISFGSFPTIQGNIKPQLAVHCGSSCDKLLRGDDVFPLRGCSPTLIC